MEYTKLIDTIMATEQTAQQIVQDTKKKHGSLDADLAQECAQLKESYLEQTKRKIAESEQQVAEQTAQSIAALDAKLAAAQAALEAEKQAHRAQWVDTLFHRIIGDIASDKAGEQS